MGNGFHLIQLGIGVWLTYINTDPTGWMQVASLWIGGAIVATALFGLSDSDDEDEKRRLHSRLVEERMARAGLLDVIRDHGLESEAKEAIDQYQRAFEERADWAETDEVAYDVLYDDTDPTDEQL